MFIKETQHFCSINLTFTHKKGRAQRTLDGLFNPKKTGGGGGGPLRPPSTFCAITLQRAKLSPRHFMTFFSRISRTFWHQICDARGYGCDKCDFVYKINANRVFSHSSYKYAYFYSQWLKLICFSIIVLQKVSATNFAEKNNKNKRSKKLRNT